LEVAKRYLEALHDDDLDTAYALLDPEVEAVSLQGNVRGPDVLRAPWSSAEYDHLEASIDRREYDERNGLVHATTHMTWRWKEGGEVAYTTRLRNGLLVREGRIARIATSVEHTPPA